MSSLLPVILSGGAGTRLWPLSRQGYPKQFLPLITKNSLFQDTLLRLRGVACASPPLVVCNEEHRFIIAAQAKAIEQPLGSILLEPEPKNTAPAIALAALEATKDGQDPLLLIMPSDHIFSRPEDFLEAIDHGIRVAQAGQLATFGVLPTYPAIGYGYIKVGFGLSDHTFQVERFIEKPNAKVAQSYLEAGGYFWNSGIFLFRASAYLEELSQFRPEILSLCRLAMEKAVSVADFCKVHAEEFAKCPSDSIDYAVMEKTSRATVIPFDAGWNDVGSWPAVWEASEKDDLGNATLGDVILRDAKNSYVNAQSRLVCVLGLDNISVIETPDVVMIMPHDRAQDIKQIVDFLKQKSRTEVSLHRKVYRPWGTYDEIDEGHRYKVKRITVKPRQRLSLQMHHHRAEHWIVVSGTALVTVEGEERLISENQSTFIPLGHKHRLENPGRVDLHMIEVQSGTYLGEDDIVRFEDSYGRTPALIQEGF